MSALAAWDVVPLHAPARDRSRLRLVPSAGPELKLATRPAPLPTPRPAKPDTARTAALAAAVMPVIERRWVMR